MRDHANPALRKMAQRCAREARRSYPLFLAGRLLGPNRRIRRWTAAFEHRLHRKLGAPTITERILSVAAVAAALCTRLSLPIDWFQHPRIGTRRFRWTPAAYGKSLALDDLKWIMQPRALKHQA